MTYDPATYWPARFRAQGPTYVAKGGRANSWREEQRQISATVASLIEPVDRLLDFGCGPGRFADLLAGYCQSYTGHDLMPESAALNPHPTIDELAGHYDLGVAIQVFQHIPDDDVIRWAGAHAKAWLVVDHDLMPNPNAHMKPRGMDGIAELLGLRVVRQAKTSTLGHWAAVFA